MNKNGFTGLEIIALIFLSSLAMNIGYNVFAPEHAKKSRCSAASKRLRACGKDVSKSKNKYEEIARISAEKTNIKLKDLEDQLIYFQCIESMMCWGNKSDKECQKSLDRCLGKDGK